MGRGKAVGLRPHDRPRAAARLGPRARGHPARQRVHALALGADEGPARRRCARSPASSRRTWRWSATGTGCRSCSRSTPGLGLPVYLGQLGLPGTDAFFLAMGRELEGRSCPSPVGTAAAEWQIAGRKNWNWGEKNLGIRDDKVLAARAARGAGREGPRPPHPGPARPEDRGGRPLLHHAAPLVHPRELRAHRDRDLRPREPEGGVPAVPGRRAHVDAAPTPASTTTSSRGSPTRCSSSSSTGRPRTSRPSPAWAAASPGRGRRCSPSTTCTTPTPATPRWWARTWRPPAAPG